MVSKTADRSRRQKQDNFCDPMALMRWSWIYATDSSQPRSLWTVPYVNSNLVSIICQATTMQLSICRNSNKRVRTTVLSLVGYTRWCPGVQCFATEECNIAVHGVTQLGVMVRVTDCVRQWPVRSLRRDCQRFLLVSWWRIERVPPASRHESPSPTDDHWSVTTHTHIIIISSSSSSSQ